MHEQARADAATARHQRRWRRQSSGRIIKPLLRSAEGKFMRSNPSSAGGARPDESGLGVLRTDDTMRKRNGRRGTVSARAGRRGTDGLLSLRFLFGLGGGFSRCRRARVRSRSRAEPAAVASGLDCLRTTLLDADGNGNSAPLSDGGRLTRRSTCLWLPGVVP